VQSEQFLKSPVREIRTQGSVRGQLGNWLFYLDGGQRTATTGNYTKKYVKKGGDGYNRYIKHNNYLAHQQLSGNTDKLHL